METSNTKSSSRVIATKERMVRMENPFSLRVGQVFTGFGIGCGIGVGVGRPLNLGAIPMLDQVMGTARGATDAFSGVGRHVNSSLRKLGAKNIEAGIGCGVGFGHGFGVGLAVKPGVVHQLQLSLIQSMSNIMKKFGVAPSLPAIQGTFPVSLQGGLSMVNEDEPSNPNPLGSVLQLSRKVPEITPQGLLDGNAVSYPETTASKNVPLKESYGSQTEKVISNFLQSPILKDDGSELDELAERVRSENNILHMVLRHQKLIDELMKENEKLHHILLEDLNISPQRLQASYFTSSRSKSPCTECFECRRRRRKR